MLLSTINADQILHVYKNLRATTRALYRVSLEVEHGTIFGLLGRNGAGKTTLVKILLGLIYPTAGEATVLGEPASSHRMRRRIGYLPEQMQIPDYFRAASFLRFMGSMNGGDAAKLSVRIPAVLERVELDDSRDKLVRDFSKGMRQRLGLAQALLNDPDVVFLDEPTDGLDPLGRRSVRALLWELRERHKTVFLNSHLLSEVELVCDQVAILERGQIVRVGTPQQLRALTGEYRVRLSVVSDRIRNAAKAVIANASWDGAAVCVRPRDRSHLNQLIDALRAVPVEIEAVEPIASTLEDAFIEAISQEEIR